MTSKRPAKPAGKKPAGKRGAEQASTQKPTEKKSATKKRAAKKSTTATTATQKSTAKKPATKKRAAKKSTTTTKRAAKKPATTKRAATGSETASAEKRPAARRPGGRRLSEAVLRANSLEESFASRKAAKAAKRGRARQRAGFQAEMLGRPDGAALGAALDRRLTDDRDTSAVFGPPPDAPRPSGGRSRATRADPAPMAFPGQNVLKWVPIGPTVTLRGQAMSRPRVSGRIRAIEVSPDGSRAYAASAKGGVWYTGDGGTTWQPVGGWASRSVNPQGNGNMFSTGALLVGFGATAVADFVMVGTGEPVPARDETGAQGQGGVGVLAAAHPVTAAVDADPWEPDAGAGVMAGLGVRRLVRHPAATAGSNSGGNQDRVLAATSGGLFLGTRAALPAVVAAPPPGPGRPPVNALPPRDGFGWIALPNAPTAVGNDVTDVLWFARPPGNTRIVYAVGGTGVFYSDNDGSAEVPIVALNAPGVAFNNRISLARVPGTNRVYVLAETGGAANVASMWQIADVIAAPQAVTAINGVPADLFGDPTDPTTQAFYDHGLAVEQVAANDRIYLGGSTVMPVNTAAGEWSASLFCFETTAPPAAPTNLAAVNGVSRRRDPPVGDGADRNGLIGNNVHPDVHAIVLTGPAAPNRHVWVGCDGGVFVSTQGGRVNTFAARNNGLATLEPIFLANHPTSSQFVLTGFQDNGAQVRVGDTMWELTFMGDGGGTMFHPVQSHITVAQWTTASWEGRPSNVYRDPMTRRANSGNIVRESNASAFYSGASSIADSATTGRMALGTNRVWIIDNLGTGTPLRWRTLPFPNGTQRDTRPGGSDPAAQRAFGVPGFVNANFTAGTVDNVIDMVWQTPTVLLVVYRGGIVRYTNTSQAAGTWTTTVWDLTSIAVAIPANHQLTAIAAVPGGQDFYVTTLGDPATPASETLWFFDNASGNFLATGFRNELDFPGPPVVTGPLDPAYAVAVDPALGTDVYVGTATGVWKGRRQVGGNWVFAPLGNGLPSATVQDLEIWQDPTGAAGSPRLLRAGVQSRGVWEVDIAQEGGGPRPDPRRTYVRVHARDDRRILPTRMANPRLAPAAAPEVAWASPDIAIRRAWPVAAPPRFLGNITFTSAPSYELWTFQTAFRWLYPSCVADGRWSDAFRDLVRQHRATLGLSAATVIDAALWRAVVGSNAPPVPGVRLRPDPTDANHALVDVDPADQLAVFRPPWHNALNFAGHATEIDLAETIVPVRTTGDEWTVYREPSTVDVLLHHRDSRPVPPGSGFTALLWQSAPTSAALQGLPAAGLDQYYRDVLTAGPGAAAPAAPAGWNTVLTAGGSAHHPLTTMFDARLPRAVSVDVDFGAVPDGHRVIVLALAGSGADDPPGLPTGAPVTVLDAVQNYRHLAARIVRMRTRPV